MSAQTHTSKAFAPMVQCTLALEPSEDFGIRTLPAHWGPVCGLFALALATADQTVEDIRTYFKTRINKPGSWKGRLYWHEMLRAMGHFKIKYEDHTLQFRGKVLTSIADDLAYGSQYIIFITGHFLTYKDGFVWDQTYNEGVPLKSAVWARRRVKKVVEVKL